MDSFFTKNVNKVIVSMALIVVTWAFFISFHKLFNNEEGLDFLWAIPLLICTGLVLLCLSYLLDFV